MLNMHIPLVALRKRTFYPCAIFFVLFGAFMPTETAIITFTGIGLAAWAFALVGSKLFLGARISFESNPHRYVLD